MTTLPARSALVLVDVQRGFDDLAFWGRRNNPGAEAAIGALAATWVGTGRPVVVVQHASAPGRPLAPDAPGHALTDVVADVPAALHVTKTVNSAFYGTPDLHAWLQAAGIGHLVVAGIQTNMCVETTVRMAGNLGYQVLLPLDATFTFDAAGPDGVVLTADELARATATSLHAGGFARVVTTEQVLAAAS